MKEKILFIDYENVRDKALLNLPEHDRVLLFIGKESLEARTQKPDAAFIKSVMGRHARLDLIPIPERGDNNLDLHLAFYLGKTLAEEPNAHYIIYTKDSTDFGPLVAHLAKRGISCERQQPPVAERAAKMPPRATPAPTPRPTPAPAPRAAAPRAPAKVVVAKAAVEKPAAAKAAPVPAQQEKAVSFLKKYPKQERPGTVKKLINRLASHLNVTPLDAGKLIHQLSQAGFLSMTSAGAVTYKF